MLARTGSAGATGFVAGTAHGRGNRRTVGEVPGVCAIIGGVLALVESMRGLSARDDHCFRASCPGHSWSSEHECPLRVTEAQQSCAWAADTASVTGHALAHSRWQCRVLASCMVPTQDAFGLHDTTCPSGLDGSTPRPATSAAASHCTARWRPRPCHPRLSRSRRTLLCAALRLRKCTCMHGSRTLGHAGVTDPLL